MKHAAATLAAILAACGPALAAACIPVDGVKARAADESMTVIEGTHDQFLFASGVYFMHPMTPLNLPPGDRVLLIEAPSGAGMLGFVDGDRICGLMTFPKEGFDALLKVGGGEVRHEGDPT